MTSYYAFTPSSRGAPSFQPTLDGQQYNVTITWGFFGQRYYVNCYGANQTLVFSIPLIESLGGIAIQSLTLGDETLTVTATTQEPHGYAIGATVALTIAGASPDAYNGAYQVLATGPDTFTYSISSNPGAATAFGNASYLVNMAAGYFLTSTMVYRNGSFEVSP